nr:transposase [Candidatus Enterovibrio escacola]
MQEGKSGRSRRKRRLSHSCPTPWAVNNLYQPIRSQLWYSVHFLYAVQVNKSLLNRGRGFIFSDIEIETALMVKGIFKLPLRRLESFLNSVFTLMNVPQESPTDTCINNTFEDGKSQVQLTESKSCRPRHY